MKKNRKNKSLALPIPSPAGGATEAAAVAPGAAPVAAVGGASTPATPAGGSTDTTVAGGSTAGGTAGATATTLPAAGGSTDTTVAANAQGQKGTQLDMLLDEALVKDEANPAGGATDVSTGPAVDGSAITEGTTMAGDTTAPADGDTLHGQ